MNICVMVSTGNTFDTECLLRRVNPEELNPVKTVRCEVSSGKYLINLNLCN